MDIVVELLQVRRDNLAVQLIDAISNLNQDLAKSMTRAS